MRVRGGDANSGEMYNSVVVDVAVTALTHMEIPLPTGSAELDGRPLAFEPNSEESRVPNCDLPISATLVTHAEGIAWASMGILLLAASTILIYFDVQNLLKTTNRNNRPTTNFNHTNCMIGRPFLD